MFCDDASIRLFTRNPFSFLYSITKAGKPAKIHTLDVRYQWGHVSLRFGSGCDSIDAVWIYYGFFCGIIPLFTVLGVSILQSK